MLGIEASQLSSPYKHFIVQLNAHNVKNLELLKQFKIKEAAAPCFSL